MDISKKDWKLYREYVPKWQTRYIEKLNREYIQLLSSEGDAADHFWELEKRIRKDKRHPGVSIGMDKSEAFFNLVLLCRTGVIGMDDLAGFSDGTVEAVKRSLELYD